MQLGTLYTNCSKGRSRLPNHPTRRVLASACCSTPSRLARREVTTLQHPVRPTAFQVPTLLRLLGDSFWQVTSCLSSDDAGRVVNDCTGNYIDIFQFSRTYPHSTKWAISVGTKIFNLNKTSFPLSTHTRMRAQTRTHTRTHVHEICAGASLYASCKHTCKYARTQSPANSMATNFDALRTSQHTWKSTIHGWHISYGILVMAY